MRGVSAAPCGGPRAPHSGVHGSAGRPLAPSTPVSAETPHTYPGPPGVTVEDAFCTCHQVGTSIADPPPALH